MYVCFVFLAKYIQVANVSGGMIYMHNDQTQNNFSVLLIKSSHLMSRSSFCHLVRSDSSLL